MRQVERLAGNRDVGKDCQRRGRRMNSDTAWGLLYYLGPPILFILLCMTAVRLAALKLKQLGGISHTLRRWLAAWSTFGFTIAVVLAVVALIMNNSFVANNAQWIWPGCLGLVAFDGKPRLPVVLMLLVVAGLQNAIVYFLLAGIVAIAFHVVGRARRKHTESPPILDR